MNIWKMIAHHEDRDSATAWTRQNERIAIGWGRVGDLLQYRSVAEISAAIRENYPIPPYKRNAHLGAPSLWDFCHTVQINDLLILKGGKDGSLVVKIVGKYEYVEGQSPTCGRLSEPTNCSGDSIRRREVVACCRRSTRNKSISNTAKMCSFSRFERLINHRFLNRLLAKVSRSTPSFPPARE